ncbi:MAG: maltose alpha-D-glucosyltransferase [Bauldia sp.]|nr:maltose alpha-D-glucosyltransferase [Bauldia sp.]
MIDRSDKYWYRDAVIYQLHVKAFQDSDGDGVGDFEGLTDSLDYIKDLGATAIWLMPFYPSPQRDDGYDISDYAGINPSYGTMRDFRRFIREAHDRGLRVITELVINHTSDQHPWFQRARRSPPGSSARDFYVWSDSDKKYSGTRIIFLDTEPSNWSWDPVAQAYYWHRFYSHQPDLNFENPRVMRAVISTMRRWLDMGVDGLRLDAIPYLAEREGTNNENLPETHVLLKQIRAIVDQLYPDRMLLAEANQWPEETAQYFGNGDECHMAFHFPLMPRMYMAIAQEDRHPVTDIMRQTPEIPEGAQWAIFLRNHDELTLEMVTDKERDYLWSFYAADRRARINLGIRRRLAPLLENDRRKIELMKSLVLSMPGTPVLYYGDEIGMGDNIYLGDRNGVRTPMQWSPDRNGGFSKGDPARLFLPTIQDPIFGFQAVNVEAQSRSTSSLLNWTRRMVAIRQNQKVFGRGALRFLYPSNRKVLAYIRELDQDRVLCVANVSRAPQAVELDLSEFKGAVPIELTGGVQFPPIGDLPYLLTLPAYGFFWFQLSSVKADEKRVAPATAPELFTLVLTGGPDTLLRGREKAAFEKTVVPGFLTAQRWFAGKGSGIKVAKLLDYALLPDGPGQNPYLLALVSTEQKSGAKQTYFLPMALDEAKEDEALVPSALARIRRGGKVGFLYDATAASDFALSVIGAMRNGTSITTAEGGTIRFARTQAMPETSASDEIRRLSVEQSNSSIRVGPAILKIYRRVQEGLNPELEIERFLTEVAGFSQIPQLYGYAEHESPEGRGSAVALLQQFVSNQGDAATFSIDTLRRELETVALAPETAPDKLHEIFSGYMRLAEVLGRRTGELHKALATPTDDPAFAAEALTEADVAATASDARGFAAKAFARLRTALETLSETARPLVEALSARQQALDRLIGDLVQEPVGAMKIRIHGDYHLGQVLIAKDDVVIVDFEGEPARSEEERRAKSTPLRDVAGMLRSFAYVEATALRDIGQRFGADSAHLRAAAAEWRKGAERSFLEAYEAAVAGSPVEVTDPATRSRLLRLHQLARALYEIDYEAGNRPDWLDIPVQGVIALLTEESPAP